MLKLPITTDLLVEVPYQPPGFYWSSETFLKCPERGQFFAWHPRYRPEIAVIVISPWGGVHADSSIGYTLIGAMNIITYIEMLQNAMSDLRRKTEEGQPKKLIPYEEFQRMARERIRSMDNRRYSPHPNGIACPMCKNELVDSQPSMTLTSNPLQKHVKCPKCLWEGLRIA